MNKPLKQNEITELASLENLRYENLFTVYQNVDGKYFYNLISKVNFPEEMDETFYSIYTTKNQEPWTMISYRNYRTPLLWWLICASNRIQNPVYFPEPGTRLKILKPEVVKGILQQINYVV